MATGVIPPGFTFPNNVCIMGVSINSKLAVAGGHPPPLVLGNFCLPIQEDCYKYRFISTNCIGVLQIDLA